MCVTSSLPQETCDIITVKGVVKFTCKLGIDFAEAVVCHPKTTKAEIYLLTFPDRLRVQKASRIPHSRGRSHGTGK